MKISTVNTTLPVNKTLTTLLFFYAISIMFTYPYGIPVVGDSYIRIPDLFALLIGGFAIIVCSLFSKTKFKLKPLLPIAPFFLLEVILPVLGAFSYGSLSDSLSGVRVMLLYLPVGVCCLFFNLDSSLKLDIKIDKLLKIAVIANLLYGIVQLGVYLGLFPQSFLISSSLESFIADEHFNEVLGLRIAGFFTNTTALSVFGIVAMSYFLSKYKAYEKIGYLLYSMSALMLVFLSTSRAAYVSALIIVVYNIFSSKLSKSIKTIVILTVAILLLLFILSFYFQINYEDFFYRFIRIREEGLSNDYSWQTRVEGIWPRVINAMHKYPMGTLIPPYKIFGFIDSGYLSYYAQGNYFFIASLIWFYIASFLYILKAKQTKRSWSVNFVFCLLIYIIPAMVVSNSMRSPTVIFALIYGLWFVSVEKKLAANPYNTK